MERIGQNQIVCEDLKNIIQEKIAWNKLNGKTILVSGANGFIASYIIETLLYLNESAILQEKLSVIGVVRNKQKADERFAHLRGRSDFSIIVSDITVPFKVEGKIDIIIHAASQASPKYFGIDPVGTLKANTIGTANLLDLARSNQTEQFIFISSGEVYGVIESPEIIVESYSGNVDITDVRSCYAESKRMGETMCVSWAHQYGFKVNMVRLAHTYGPGVSLDDGRVFADFTKNILNNENIILKSEGNAKRCFLYITDMIRSLFFVIFYGTDGTAYNIAADDEISIRDLADLFVGLYPEKKLAVELSLSVVTNGYIPSKSSSINLSTERLKALGWVQKISLHEGFKRMVESYYK